MNFQALKWGFKEYLKDTGKIEKHEMTAENDACIFTYADEFKTYLASRTGVSGSEIQSKTISEILKAGLDDEGRLLDSRRTISDEELNLYDMLLSGAGSENNADMFTNVFNELIKSDKFKDAVDIDKSGDIDDSELEDFLHNVKGLDGNNKDVSIEDLLTAAQIINDEEFNIAETEEDFTDDETSAIAEDMQDKKPAKTEYLPSRSSTGKLNKAGRYSGKYDNSKTAKKLYNMTEDELKEALKQAQNNLSVKQGILSGIIDGSDSHIKALEDAVNSSYEIYQEQLKILNEDTAVKMTELQQKTDEKQNEIDAKDKEISNKESEVSSAQSSYDNAKASKENLENILTELEASNSKDNDLSSKISEVKSQLEAAKETETKAEEALKTAKDELEQLKNERRELEEGEGGLNELKEQMTQLEAEISEQNAEVQQAKQAWDNAKETLEKEKAAAIAAAKTQVSNAQKKVDEIKSALTECQNYDKQNKYLNQYNKNAGETLADAAHKTAGTTGYCLRGVNNTLERVYGMKINAGSAYKAADILASNQGIGAHFKEVQVSRKDLKKLPAGAVVVWNNNAEGGGSNVSRAGRVHGHISIALGDGRESSDHIQSQIVNRDASFRVFYPVS